MSLLEIVVSSSARSLVLLFYYNKWGCVIFYNPWKVLAACKTLLLFFFACSPFHIFILLLLWRFFFIFPSTSGMYFANLCVTVPTHLVINWALGKTNSIPRDNLIGPVGSDTVWNRYWCCSEYLWWKRIKVFKHDWWLHSSPHWFISYTHFTLLLSDKIFDISL